ncbi:MAG: hypothetical protein ACKVZJ_10885 [Phycisphaerales bacterium]
MTAKVVQFQPRPTPTQEWLSGEMALVRLPSHWSPELTEKARQMLAKLLLEQINPQPAPNVPRKP